MLDRQGTATKQTNAGASTTATRTYDAFGMLVASTGTPRGPFGFAGASGYQEDGDSGLKLLGHRYYDPSTGRFLTRDPAQDGRNWYAYVDGNPLKCVDPEGYQAGFLGAVIKAGQALGAKKVADKIADIIKPHKHPKPPNKQPKPPIVDPSTVPPGSIVIVYPNGEYVVEPPGSSVPTGSNVSISVLPNGTTVVYFH